MSRYRVYANSEGDGFLLDVQANLLSHLSTCVVVPLLPVDAAPKPARTLNPMFEITGVPHVMVTQFIAAVPRRLFASEVADLQEQAHEIVNALDCLFQGV
ncbi:MULTISPECIES: CcdB family protein [Ramlibacter]|uniref:Toxin CcdB n=1 Tax=Ramlibacter pinisoli TaxID=2682844 RepID=A0A6N8IM06_9BURK|nr:MULTISPECIES: CcdB family protein [Ramlibacter]MBA2960509.1 CcdB family protein [Ramlibacter sp. CGMCC 1.13660]MVQ27841.1 plasmid maintenance protein CcdB [Ramlibacter pinisoli]